MYIDNSSFFILFFTLQNFFLKSKLTRLFVPNAVLFPFAALNKLFQAAA